MRASPWIDWSARGSIGRIVDGRQGEFEKPQTVPPQTVMSDTAGLSPIHFLASASVSKERICCCTPWVSVITTAQLESSSWIGSNLRVRLHALIIEVENQSCYGENYLRGQMTVSPRKQEVSLTAHKAAHYVGLGVVRRAYQCA